MPSLTAPAASASRPSPILPRIPLHAAAMLAPFALAYGLFFLWPAAQTLWLSFTESSTTSTTGFVGLSNYIA
ncbi:MAG: hypothetical protein NTZ15_09645, partial [Burkholderiales bacterium]|nr:hypothetical protein [Burkholderiales bacterium]